MSRLTDLLVRLRSENEGLAADLEKEISALAERRSFGLNFERHVPEAVELSGRPVRKGDKVRVLPPRGQLPTKENEKLWQVVGIDGKAGTASLESLIGKVAQDELGPETTSTALDNLVVVAQFRDAIYPGLVSTGKVERGGDKPYHVVINAENYHALETLLFTHRGKVDVIYIDPPYNTGAKDWKYNNDYVEGDDVYRHSKWLAMMERRLLLAKQLLIPDDSVLIVTIDEREGNRLGLLLDQTFPDARIQMVSTLTNPKGVSVNGGFRRADEYIYIVMMGAATPARLELKAEWSSSPKQAAKGDSLMDQDREVEPDWTSMMRRGSNSARSDRPTMFYPIYVDPGTVTIREIGNALPPGISRAPERPGLVAVLPLRRNGNEGRWQVGPQELRQRIEQGRVRLGRPTAYGYVVNYLPDGAYADVVAGKYELLGRAYDGSLIARKTAGLDERIAPTQWKIESHNASEHGSSLLDKFLPERAFPFPKSLYAVEDALRFFVADRPSAVILDFFAGSGTTAHAVMRLNRQDGAQRHSISITNNEVSVDEQKELRERGLRSGDPGWEGRGICEYITKPRIEAAITGVTPDGEQIKGIYKFADEFPMADGFEANVEFFSLTYEAPLRVASNREFAKIAPLLWMRAGSRGRRICDVTAGWDVADAYGVLADLDHTEEFLKSVTARAESLTTAFIITDEDRLFESVARELPDHVEPVRLYEAYLRNFEIESGRGLL